MSEELPPIWALDKAAKAAGYDSWRESKILYTEGSGVQDSIIAHARTIAQYEQPPVDEDEVSLMRVLCAWYGFDGGLHDPGDFKRDWKVTWPVTLAQFKRELEGRK
jgi:hypothetical protein